MVLDRFISEAETLHPSIHKGIENGDAQPKEASVKDLFVFF
jgi:hypothetical protein